MDCSIDIVYKEFEKRPMAAVSLGQEMCDLGNQLLFTSVPVHSFVYHWYIVQCSIMVSELQSKFSDQAQKLYSSAYLGHCQEVLVTYTFGDIYKW